MSRKRNVITMLNIVLLGVLMTFNNCGDYRTPRTQKTSTMGNPNRMEKTDFAVSKYQDLNSLSICLKELVLTKVGGETVVVPYSPYNEIQISMSGMELGSLNVPSGQYTKIELGVADVCGTGKSVSINNSRGAFSSAASLLIKFIGNEFVGNIQHKIVLDVKSLTENLSKVAANGDVDSQATGSTGLYHSLGCGMQTTTGSVAFCESFDKPSVVKGRSAQLDNSIWSVARMNFSNQGQGQFNVWSPSVIDACGTMQNAIPGISDLVVCNGQLRQSTNDDDAVTAFTFSPNQPFDFKDRTGTVAFDITNDTSGTIGVYPEIYLSDKALPAAQNFGGFKSFPQNGISLRFAGTIIPQSGGRLPGCPNDEHDRWVLDKVSFISNYSERSISVWDNNPQFVTYGCVIASKGPNDGMNHIELRVSQDQVEVWATDAGDAGLKKIAAIKNVALPFNRGYLSFGDYHNRPSAGPRPAHTNHTFAWDNIAFDGPALARDLSFDVPDSMAARGDGTYNLGWNTFPSTPANLTTLPISSQQIAAASASGKTPMLTFNFHSSFTTVTSFQYTVNGVQLNGVVPFVVLQNEYRAIDLPIPVSALVPGQQSISIGGNDTAVIYNVNVRLPMN